MNGNEKKEKPKTIGEAIDEEVAKIIDMANWERKNDHPWYGKTNKEVAELLLTDNYMAIFENEEIMKKVREHFKED